MRRTADVGSVVYLAAALVLAGCTERLELPTREVVADAGREGGRSDGQERDTGGQPVSCGDPLALLPFHNADVVFVLGRNSSMSQKFGSTTRIQAATDAVSAGLNLFPSGIRYGYADFPSDRPGSCGGNAGCCANFDSGLRSGFNHAGTIQTFLSVCGNGTGSGCVSQIDARPLGDALSLAGTLFSQGGSENRSIFLLTDGEPSCSNEPPATSCSEAQFQISLLPPPDRNSGVTLHVFTLGQPTDMSSCLKSLANSTGTSLVQSDSPTSLRNDVSAALAEIASAYCSFDLRTPISQDQSNALRLFINGTAVPPNESDGWAFRPGSQSRIDLHGGACAKLQTSMTPDVLVQICR